MIKNKKIILGVSGGIAAYKSADLVRKLVVQGAEVKVIMTKNALNFIQPLTFQTLSKNAVYTDVFANNQYTTEHISHADWADILLIAPATANIIGKFASGIADDALSTTFLAFNKKVIIAPAMNVNMFNHPVVQKNICYLKSIGVSFVEPSVGELACGIVAQGRMKEPSEIIDFLNSIL